MVLEVVVTLIVVCWWFYLALGAGNIFKALVQSRDEGELVLIPLVVLAATLLRPRLADLIPPPSSSWWPALPLILAGALLALVPFLGWVWAGPSTFLSPVRFLSALLMVAVTFAAAAVHPRLMAVLAGAIAAPAVFAIAAYMVPDELIKTIGAEQADSSSRILLDGWYQTELSQTSGGMALYHLMGWVGYWSPATLLGASFLSFRLRRPALGHACWAGAVALFVGMGQFYAQMVGQGWGQQ